MCVLQVSYVQVWMKKAATKKALIIQGRPGWGKTRLAEAVLMELTGAYHFISSRDQLKHITFMPGDSLLWDEAAYF